MKIEVAMTRKQRTKNKMADSDCGLRHHYLLNLPIAKCVYSIIFVCMRYVKKFGCHYNQSGVLKIEILILLRLARFQNLGTPPNQWPQWCLVGFHQKVFRNCFIIVFDRGE